ncbi:MAG: hypothetical protein ACXVSE_04350 [Solirubrobacteraceae bacterium]
MLRRARETGAAASRGMAFDAGVAAAALLILAGLGLRTLSDWQLEARPAVTALLAGHIAQFLHLAPVYGASLILRAPFMALAKLWHGGALAIYRLSAMPCMLAIGALGIWLARRLRARGASFFARAVVVLVCAANPLALSALQFGHPEELLSAVLCVAAVLCALRGRTAWAAILLGVAIADKQWAVIATGPVLVALPHHRLRALLTAGGVATALMAPFLIGAAGGFTGQATAVGLHPGALFFPFQIWWFFGSHAHDMTLPGHPMMVLRTPPAWLGSLGHTLPIVIMPPLTVLYARLRPAPCGRGPEVLLLLATLLALRCALDPWDNSYYSLGWMLALVSWEALTYARPPVLSLMATLAAWIILRATSGFGIGLPTDTEALIFLLVSVPGICALAVAVYVPEVGRRLVPRSRRAHVAATATATA